MNITFKRFTYFAIAEAFVASIAASVSVYMLSAPVWIMFIGWVSFFTKVSSTKNGILNVICTIIGLLIGFVAIFSIKSLSFLVGSYALSIVVFFVALIVLLMGKLPVLNNILSYFLGLIAFFALHKDPSISTFFELCLPLFIGGLAALLAMEIQKKLL